MPDQVDELGSEAIGGLQREEAARQGYQLADYRLALYGYCGACIKARGRRAGAP